MKQLRDVGQYLRQSDALPTHILVHLTWLHTPLFGYGMSVFCVALAILLAKSVLPNDVHFVWLPFCLASVFVGFLWGVSPALFATLLGFLAFNLFVIPQSDVLTMDIWHDVRILGPFVFAQCMIAFLAAQNAVKHRRVRVARQELQARAQELVAVNQALEQANQRKDYFMTRAAHELRTPLTTILGETQLALRRLHKNGEIALDCRKSFEKVEARARSLQNLIEDLLDLSSLRSGQTHLRAGQCNFGALCRTEVAEQRARTGRQITFQLPAATEPLILWADGERLAQVVNNLLNNAIRYSLNPTAVHVNLNTDATGALLQVQNDGPMLEQEQQERLFDEFYRTPLVENTSNGGYGLGLTISKEIVERHGGQIWVESEKEQGITFFVHLPFRDPTRADGVRLEHDEYE